MIPQRKRMCAFFCALVQAATLSAFSQTADPILANAKREPKMLAFSRVIGGSGRENVGAATTDQRGFIYVSGTTASEDFPITPGAPRAPLGCRTNQYSQKTECKAATFVMKLSPDASDLIYSATIDSSYSPLVPWTIAAAPDGSVYVAGQVFEPESFPATPGAYRSTCTARWCAFLLKVNPDGGALEFATFFAGSAGDLPLQVMADSEGRAWVKGLVQSTDYPVTPDAFQPAPGFGYHDFFLSVFSADGKELVYSTFFGGNGMEGAAGRLLSSSEILFAGGTSSSNFPVTSDAFQKTRASNDAFYQDGFLAVLNIKTGLKYSTYLGGSFDDRLQSAVSTPRGNLFFSGRTTSRDFPGAAPVVSGPTVSFAMTGYFDGARQHVQVKTYSGYGSARILSTSALFAYVEFRSLTVTADGRIVVGSVSTIGKVSLADNTIVSAYQLPDRTPESDGHAVAPGGILVVADNQYINYQLPNETTDIQIRGFRYAERSFAWAMPSALAMQLLRGQTLTLPLTLRDVGSGVPARVKIRCEQVPLDVECSVPTEEIELEDAASIDLVIRQRPVAQAGLFVPAGLMLLGLMAQRGRGRLLAVSALGLALVACGPVRETAQQRSITLVAESASQRSDITLQLIVE